MAEPRSPDPSAGTLIAVLAGGAGSRLGGDKATAELSGRPLIEYPLEAARAAAAGGPAEVVVVAKPDSALPPFPERVLREPEQPRHPLCGIVAALREADGHAVVAVACDMPFATSELIAWLANVPERLAVPRASGRLHPLLGRYGGELLPRLEAALADEAALQQTVAALDPLELGEAELSRFGDPERLLFNVNTAADLQTAEGLAASGSA